MEPAELIESTSEVGTVASYCVDVIEAVKLAVSLFKAWSKSDDCTAEYSLVAVNREGAIDNDDKDWTKLLYGSIESKVKMEELPLVLLEVPVDL